ncbi:kinase-like protein [Westerdykella ornata]|uniref:Kinase-like protein n=1 Tax=Westerdykella ornata TaxID=318751 RepID=A0A6A6JMM6_WESOR|nr:kinase-like protein [Westerdykella ornata]KAF2276179.1 kinase-like protein [Westerdykella ornata]
MSMFRKPGDSSSSDESSEEDHESSKNHSVPVAKETVRLSSRRNANNAIASRSGRATPLSSQPALSRNASYVRDLLLHSLLEERVLRETAEQLGKNADDPEVREIARTTYQALSRQLAGQNEDNYTSDSMRSQRAAIQDVLGTATRSHIASLTARNGGSTRALARGSSSLGMTAMNPFANFPSTVDRHLNSLPGLHTDRYVREFLELQVVGKGGYGTVFKVKHKLDNSFYAVKRIMVSPERLRRIRENGPHEIEQMLEEVRALAKLDHGNIVRYHNCWLEFTTQPGDLPAAPERIRNNLLLEHGSGSDHEVSNLQAGVQSLTFEHSLDNLQMDASPGIVFEYTDGDTGARAEQPPDNGNLKMPPTQRQRSSSQATIQTISSMRSRLSTIEDDDEIEVIERNHKPQYPHPSSDVSESLMSDSNLPGRPLVGRTTGPVLTLNVQMSLYDTNLAEYLSCEQSPAPADQVHHCFHTCISLELLASIISGVEYLHAQGVVHRDLKPANVFLALSSSTKISPSGSIDASTCSSCPSRECLYVTPRIGDFGLVAALGEGCFANDQFVKAVGTQFYRPEGGDTKVSEKLDVFALGIMAFEMLQGFSTKMERAETLRRLRQGVFPPNFADRVGMEVQSLIGNMIHADEEMRLTCEEVKRQLGRIIEGLRQQR